MKGVRIKIKKLLTEISPELTTRLMFFYNFGKPLNLHNSKDINEKLQYLKLKTYYDNPIITQCVDKLLVKEYLINCGYKKLLAELYDVMDNSKNLVKAWGGIRTPL